MIPKGPILCTASATWYGSIKMATAVSCGAREAAKGLPREREHLFPGKAPAAPKDLLGAPMDLFSWCRNKKTSVRFQGSAGEIGLGP